MKKNLLANIIFTFGIGIIVAFLCASSIFEKLDFRLYDSLLHTTKDPELSDKITVLAITDEDINSLGEWPWSRDIIADVLIRLKEMGAEASIFDIEYISKSQQAVAENAIINVNNQIYQAEQYSGDLIRAIPKAIKQGYPVSEADYLAENLINEELYDVYTNLYDYVGNHIAFDNDEYFAKAIQFFGKTYLTVNNLDLKIQNNTQEDLNFIKANMLFNNVKDPNGYIVHENEINFKETYPDAKKGFSPALNTLIRRAHGIGYTNSNIDDDGIRRRNELFVEYDGKYIGQLTFGPLMDILDVQSFERKKNSLVVYGAKFPDETERTDFTIPLDEKGRMLINWQHEASQDNAEKPEEMFGIKYVPIYNFKQLDLLEKGINSNLNHLYEIPPVFDDEGLPLQYYFDLASLIEYAQYLDEFKTSLLDLCTGYDNNGTPYDGLTDSDYEEYFSTRKDFFNQVKVFAEKNYYNELIDFIYDEGLEGYYSEDLLEDIQLTFNEIKENINDYLANNEYWKTKVEGKYCIFGQTAASTTDIGANPFSKQYINVLIHANIMNTVLTRNFITPYPWFYGFAVAFLVSLLLTLLSGCSSAVENLVGGVVRIAVIVAFLLLLPLFGIYIPCVGGVIFYLIVDYFAGLIYRYVISSQEKKFITEIASSFANKDTVEQLKANPDAFNTKGEKKIITALFSDVQKFSTLTENINKIYKDEGPNKIVEILNEYLGEMSNDILKNDGTIDKYEGDAIISMFGAPDPLNIHTKEEWAYNCLESAINMKKTEVHFNDTHKELFEPVEVTMEDGSVETVQLKPLQTRIGINTGDAYVGLMGSKTDAFSKLNYTMMGDTVNLASRLEGVNKVYGTWIMCSEDTWINANSGANLGKITVRRLDRVRVVGRANPVQLYNVLGFTEELSQLQLEELAVFHNALDLYLNKNFTEAGKLFVNASKMLPEGDPTAIVFAERCKKYITEGVSENWDGVMNMTSK